MTPQQNLEARVAELERIVRAMQEGADVPFTETLKRRTFQDVILSGVRDTASTSNINQSVLGTDPFTSPKAYNHRLRVEVDGNPYYVGLYSV